MQVKTPKDLIILIRCVCESFDGHADENEVALLLGTAAVESGFKSRVQWLSGPARGLWQMEPVTARDVFENYLIRRADLWLRLVQWFPDYSLSIMPTKKELSGYLRDDDRFACVMARIHYLRKTAPIPTTLTGQAEYWKANYNTKAGRGTVEKYLAAWEACGCDALMACMLSAING